MNIHKAALSIAFWVGIGEYASKVGRFGTSYGSLSLILWRGYVWAAIRYFHES